MCNDIDVSDQTRVAFSHEIHFTLQRYNHVIYPFLYPISIFMSSPHQTSSGPANPKACLLVGAPSLKNGFSANAVTLVPCLGSLPS